MSGDFEIPIFAINHQTMKKFSSTFVLLAACMVFGFANGLPYSITGQIDPAGGSGQVTLSTFDPVTQQKEVIATAAVGADNRYSIEYEFSEPDLFQLDFPGRYKTMLAIDAGQRHIEVNVKGEAGTIEIVGSPDSEKLLAYDAFRGESFQRLIRPTYNAMRAAAKEAGANPTEEIKAVEAYVEASQLHRKELIDFTEKNIGTSVALFGTVLRWTGDDEVQRLDKLVTAFKAAHPGLKMTQVMEDKVARYKKVAIGADAPALSDKNPDGSMVSLAEARGKVTLIDFWASWCGPCLRQIPDLKDAYAKYHSKGFEIFGVSVDSKPEKWKAAIAKYGMEWPNVSDLKGWGSEAAAAYNVTFVPFNVLIDENGKIIAKNLHSKTLQGKLAELLD